MKKNALLIFCIVFSLLSNAQSNPNKDFTGPAVNSLPHIRNFKISPKPPRTPAESAQMHSSIDSATSELLSERYRNGNDTNKILLLWSIANMYTFINGDSFCHYAEQGLKNSEQIDYQFGMGLCLELLGRFNPGRNYNNALEYCFRALKAYEATNRPWHIAQVLDAIGGLYYDMEQYHIALEYFEKEKREFEIMSDSDGLAHTYHSIGGTYLSMGNSSKAVASELLALALFEKLGQTHKMRSVFLNLSVHYAELKQYNEAVYYSAKAVRMARANPTYTYFLPEALKDKGYIHYLIAIDSNTILRPDSLLQADRKINLALAIRNYRESYELYTKSNIVNIEILGRLSTALGLAGNYKEALWFYQQHIAERDSQISDKIQLQAAAQAIKREAELKEKQIVINKFQARQKRNGQVFFISGIGLLSIVIILIFKNYKKEKQANLRLADEKAKSDELAATLQESIFQKDALAAQLSASAAMKSKFLANISHELRTPVTLLTGMLELMRDKNVAEKEAVVDKYKLNLAYSNSRKLQYMVEEILDLSKLESNQLKLYIKEVEIAPLIKRMVYAFETLIQKEQLNLIYSDTSATGIFVSVDEDRFEKIINNLIYNAIKFNIKGGNIKVAVQPLVENNSVLICINNTGAGISAQDLPHIFERFYQGDTSRAKAEGAGIGLSLVKEFTLLMAGSVDVVSTIEAGTTFTLQFPIVECEESDEDVAEITMPVEEWGHFTQQQTVLLVEDNLEMRYYLKEVLGGKVTLAEAANGIEALKWLENNTPNLIISDIMMPEMDGQEFVTVLKNKEQYKNIPVITLTALADKDSRIGMLRMGVDDYIVKPFNTTELRIRVYNLLNNYSERVLFTKLPAEPDDVPANSKEAEEFRGRITTFVLSRIKNSTISVYDIAYELSLSERQLYRLCKSLTGCTPAQLIKEVRLQRAYELLLSGDIYKIDDVSRRVGFETSAYFSRQFYERFGKKATEFI